MVSARLSRWLDKRIPPSNSVKLTQRSVFVFPTLEGLIFCSLLLLLLLTAINYQNSMIYMFTFFLASLFQVVIFHSFQNLSGLRFTFKKVEPVFVGESAGFLISIGSENQNRSHYSIGVMWPDNPMAHLPVVKPGQALTQLSVPIVAKKRGYLKPGRVLIESRYPFGLIRAWSWVDLDCQMLVYPAPIEGRYKREASSDAVGDSLEAQTGVDDFKGIKAYAAGDSLKRIDWKRYAKRGEVLVKEFETPVSDTCFFSLSDYLSADMESRLSHLCFDILQADVAGDVYGVRLGTETLEPAAGHRHLMHCLQALALYKVPRHNT
ncbi:MAG: DUF58 domain-containing protein [Gammaproteobacteria bacterium]|nr:MAG: DUF58 domain-containing protein [Gammaproteobacteria bacterium]